MINHEEHEAHKGTDLYEPTFVSNVSF